MNLLGQTLKSPFESSQLNLQLPNGSSLDPKANPNQSGQLGGLASQLTPPTSDALIKGATRAPAEPASSTPEKNIQKTETPLSAEEEAMGQCLPKEEESSSVSSTTPAPAPTQADQFSSVDGSLEKKSEAVIESFGTPIGFGFAQKFFRDNAGFRAQINESLAQSTPPAENLESNLDADWELHSSVLDGDGLSGVWQSQKSGESYSGGGEYDYLAQICKPSLLDQQLSLGDYTPATDPVYSARYLQTKENPKATPKEVVVAVLPQVEIDQNQTAETTIQAETPAYLKYTPRSESKELKIESQDSTKVPAEPVFTTLSAALTSATNVSNESPEAEVVEARNVLVASAEVSEMPEIVILENRPQAKTRSVVVESVKVSQNDTETPVNMAQITADEVANQVFHSQSLLTNSHGRLVEDSTLGAESEKSSTETILTTPLQKNVSFTSVYTSSLPSDTGVETLQLHRDHVENQAMMMGENSSFSQRIYWSGIQTVTDGNHPDRLVSVVSSDPSYAQILLKDQQRNPTSQTPLPDRYFVFIHSGMLSIRQAQQSWAISDNIDDAISGRSFDRNLHTVSENGFTQSGQDGHSEDNQQNIYFSQLEGVENSEGLHEEVDSSEDDTRFQQIPVDVIV